MAEQKESKPMRTKRGARFHLYPAIVGLALLLAAMLSGIGTAAAAPSRSGTVYVLTNAAAGNAVVVFERVADGTLMQAGAVPTGGKGTGSGLGSQGALVLSDNGHWLFAVNAGVYAFEAGLRETVEWYLGNQDWVDSVTSGEYQKWISRNYAARTAA
jgi:hypothetical protein